MLIPGLNIFTDHCNIPWYLLYMYTLAQLAEYFDTITHPGIKFQSFYHYRYALVYTKPIPTQYWYEATFLRPFQ